eukprot:215231-Pelagomonas_calceolata.AAC.7
MQWGGAAQMHWCFKLELICRYMLAFQALPHNCSNSTGGAQTSRTRGKGMTCVVDEVSNSAASQCLLYPASSHTN